MNIRLSELSRTPILNLMFQLSALTLAMGAVNFLGVALLNSFQSPALSQVAASINVAALASMVIQIGIWSALGPGTYYQRFLVAYGIGLMGIAVFTSMRAGQFNTPSFQATQFFMASLPLLLLGAQLPFWLFRILFAWKLAQRNSAPSPSFRINDLFILTFVIAASIFLQQPNPRFAASTAALVAPFALGVMGISIIVVPAFSIFFRGKDLTTGCRRSLGYISLCFLVAVGVAFYFTAGQGAGYLFLVGGLSVAWMSFTLGLPWVLARNLGFELITNKRFPSQQTNRENKTEFAAAEGIEKQPTGQLKLVD